MFTLLRAQRSSCGSDDDAAELGRPRSTMAQSTVARRCADTSRKLVAMSQSIPLSQSRNPSWVSRASTRLSSTSNVRSDCPAGVAVSVFPLPGRPGRPSVGREEAFTSSPGVTANSFQIPPTQTTGADTPGIPVGQQIHRTSARSVLRPGAAGISVENLTGFRGGNRPLGFRRS